MSKKACSIVFIQNISDHKCLAKHTYNNHNSDVVLYLSSLNVP